jgi:uncharacterized protein
MLSVIFFWGIIILLKPCLYFSTYRFFKKKLFKRLTIALFLSSVLSVVAGIYCMRISFSKGISNMTFVPNFFMALMFSIFVCELIVASFFLLQNILSLLRSLALKILDRPSPEAADRRNFLKKGGLLIGGGVFTAFLYGITFGKYNYKVRNLILKFEDLPEAFDGFRIAQISDIHAGSFDNEAAVRKGFRLLQEQMADVILFTGDLVNSYASEIEPYLKDLKELKAPYGKFSVLGNHDYPMYKRMFKDDEHSDRNLNEIKMHHKNTGFNLLLNSNTKIEKDGQYIRLTGVENWGRSRHFPKLGDLDIATENCENEEFTILMSHDPTHWEDKVKNYHKHIHLTVSGHTHGMQMGIDLPSFRWSPIKYFYKHWAGLYTENGKHLYVNRGFGFLGFAGRVGVYPEITVYELKKGKT